MFSNLRKRTVSGVGRMSLSIHLSELYFIQGDVARLSENWTKCPSYRLRAFVV